MLAKRLVFVLYLYNGALYRSKNFVPDYMYTINYVDTATVDEIVILDISGYSSHDPALFSTTVSEITRSCFVPVTLGGNIRSVEDARLLFDLGADKISLNTLLFTQPEVVLDLVSIFGSQAIIASLDFKQELDSYKGYIKGGKIPVEKDLCAIIAHCIELGVGEILLSSINRDGSLLGYDISLLSQVSQLTSIPILANSGAGNWNHFLRAFTEASVDAVCTSNIYHFTTRSIVSAKTYLAKNGIPIRDV